MGFVEVYVEFANKKGATDSVLLERDGEGFEGNLESDRQKS